MAGQVSGKSAHFSTLDRGARGHLDRHWEPGDPTHKPSRGKGSSGGLAGGPDSQNPHEGQHVALRPSQLRVGFARVAGL